MRVLNVALGIAVCALVGPAGFGQCDWQREANPEVVQNGFFGDSVALGDDVAIIGAPGNRAVFVYERTVAGWKSVEDLAPVSGCCRVKGFGAAVALWESTIVVGAPDDDPLGVDSGSAYVFRYDGSHWLEVAKLTASDGAAGNRFGTSVSLRKGTIMVGAPSSAAHPTVGAVYVFEESTAGWAQTAKLTASDAALNSWFGASLGMTAGRAVIGAPWAKAAYVFDWVGGGWSEQAKLVAHDGQLGTWVAWSVAIDEPGSTIVLAAPWHGEWHVHLDDWAGAAWVFERSSDGDWHETAELVGADYAFLNRAAGRSVAIDKDTIALSVDYQFDAEGGAIWLFERLASGGWRSGESRQLDGMRLGSAEEQFGESLALRNNTLLAGARFATAGAHRSGAAYWMDLDPLGETYCCPRARNSIGGIGRIWASGSRRIAEDDLALGSSGLPPGNIGMFLAGEGAEQVLPAGSAGPICVAGGVSGIHRLGTVLSTDQLGDGFSLSIGTHGIPGLGTIVPGRTYNFQAWYRDNAGSTSNLTNALSIRFE